MALFLNTDKKNNNDFSFQHFLYSPIGYTMPTT